MKVYFENGPLLAMNSLSLECDHIINAACGYSNNEEAFEKIMAVNPNASIYTNSLAAFINAIHYCWDDKTFELYIQKGKNGEFTRIDKLTNRELREGHNLLKMWLAGEFE